MKHLSWTQLTCTSSEPEEASVWAVEFGAKGSQLIDESTFLVFIDRTELLPHIREKLTSIGASIVNEEQIVEENWVKNCYDLWQPVTIGQITLKPVLDGEGELVGTPNSRNEINIIPGNGFGTGHHESTQLALDLLQSPIFSDSRPTNVLDVGTGNGVLALAVASLFQIPVRALDNDELAIRNAEQNLALNKSLAQFVTLENGELKNGDKGYDLILANIYSHTLCELADLFYSSQPESGYLVLSGIMINQREDIETTYCPPKWDLLKSIEKNGWIGYLYKRVP